MKGGVCVVAHKSEPRAHGCVPQGVWSQRCTFSLQTCTNPNLQGSASRRCLSNAEKRQAICGCERLLVGAWQVMYAIDRSHLSVCHITLQQVILWLCGVCRGMQTSNRSRLAHFLFWWGDGKVFLGWGGPGGATPKFRHPVN